MNKLKDLEPKSVFKYFEELSQVPRGSGNMDAVSSYCEEFAKAHSLKYYRDSANNVIIYKDASEGYENSDPVILQAHLDMVCQKDEGVEIDFEKEAIDIYVDGDFIKARGTTLGADNGISAACLLAILESDEIEHPPLEVVFTTDEEIGMIGAMALDFDKLKGKKMINADSEEPGIVTVSCAGGSDFVSKIPVEYQISAGDGVSVTVRGLKGGHSGVEIDKGRINANVLLGRILNRLSENAGFEIADINGGDKANAIPLLAQANLVVQNGKSFVIKANEYANIIKEEMSAREENLEIEIKLAGEVKTKVFDKNARDNIVYALTCVPNGVITMSAEIEGLVETSLNLGILKTQDDGVILHHALRSNKKSALAFLEDRLRTFYKIAKCSVETFGHYPPWEYNDNSLLQTLYCDIYKETTGKDALVKAIHAGLECGVFASNIEGFDCISIGPEMYDIHTTSERVSISSVKETYEIILKLLKRSK